MNDGKNAYYTIPSRWFDLNAIGEIMQAMRELGITFYMNGIYPGFPSAEERGKAMQRVYFESFWTDKWRIREWLEENGLVTMTYVKDHIRAVAQSVISEYPLKEDEIPALEKYIKLYNDLKNRGITL